MNRVNEKAAELRQLRAELGDVEMRVITNYTLADAIREGSQVTEHEQSGWGDGVRACALTTAVVAARSHGWV